MKSLDCLNLRFTEHFYAIFSGYFRFGREIFHRFFGEQANILENMVIFVKFWRLSIGFLQRYRL